MTADEVRHFMIRWNNKFPVDRWWRKKHNIPFLSALHREQSFLNQLMEFEEEKLFLELSEKRNDINSPDKYIPNEGDFFKIRVLTEEDAKKPIDQDDIESFRREAEEIRKREEDGDSGQDNKDNG